MSEMDERLTLLFQDEPISEASLQRLQKGIMSQILANPIDFQAKILMAKRRKWGIALLAMLLVTGLSVLGLIWFEGDWLLSLMGQIPNWFLQKWIMLNHLKVGLNYLWQQYVWSFMGIAFTWVLFDGIRHKMLVKD